MIDDIALSCKATSTGTRIATLLIQTGQVAGTFRVDCTLRATVGCGSNKVGQATATGATIDFATLRVRSTWRRYTRHCGSFRLLLLLWRHRQATYEGISGKARLARAQRTVVAHMALSIQSASTRAGICTLLIDAGLIRGTLGTDDALGTTGRWSSHKFR